MEDRMLKTNKNFGFTNSPVSSTSKNGKTYMTTSMITFIKISLCEKFEQKSVLINKEINNAKNWQGEGHNKRKVQGIFELKKRGINQWKRLSIS